MGGQIGRPVISCVEQELIHSANMDWGPVIGQRLWVPLWLSCSSSCLHEGYSLIRWVDDKNKCQRKKCREGRFLVPRVVEEEGAAQVSKKSFLQEKASELVSSKFNLCLWVMVSADSEPCITTFVDKYDVGWLQSWPTLCRLWERWRLRFPEAAQLRGDTDRERWS